MTSARHDLIHKVRNV